MLRVESFGSGSQGRTRWELAPFLGAETLLPSSQPGTEAENQVGVLPSHHSPPSGGSWEPKKCRVKLGDNVLDFIFCFGVGSIGNMQS